MHWCVGVLEGGLYRVLHGVLVCWRGASMFYSSCVHLVFSYNNILFVLCSAHAHY